MRRVKMSLTHISPAFDCRRMVHEYMTELYEPAHSGHLRMRKADYALSREKTRWNARVREVWDRVRFVDGGPGPAGSLVSGHAVAVRAAIDLAGLTPGDVRVEVVIGRVDSNGHLEETEVIVLPFVEQQEAAAVFAKDIIPERTGRLGYALRVSPNHYDDPADPPCASLLKWSSRGVDPCFRKERAFHLRSVVHMYLKQRRVPTCCLLNPRNPRQAPLAIPRHNCCRGNSLAALWERSAVLLIDVETGVESDRN